MKLTLSVHYHLLFGVLLLRLCGYGGFRVSFRRVYGVVVEVFRQFSRCKTFKVHEKCFTCLDGTKFFFCVSSNAVFKSKT